MNPLRFHAALLGAACSLALTAAAQGVDAPGVLPVIRVTAPKDSPPPSGLALGAGAALAPLQTPFSIDQVSAETLRAQAGNSLQDALRNVPGAQADSGFNGAHAPFFILRGAVTDSGTGSSRVLRDGVRLSNYAFTPAFVESVDVLRGPGAALGVRSEPGGSVNLVTRQPQQADFGSALLSAGSADARELSLDWNRVLSPAHGLAARITATRSQASAWRDAPSVLDGIKLGLAHRDGERLHLRAGFEATDQAYRPDYGLPALDGRPVAVPLARQLGEPFGDSRTRNRIADLHGDMALDSRTRLALALTHLASEASSIKNLLNGAPLAGQPAGTWARISAWEPETTRRIGSASASLTRRQLLAGIEHHLVFGLEHYTEQLDQPALSVPAATSPPINVYDPVYGRVTAPPAGTVLARTLTTQDLEAAAALLQDRFDWGPWTVVAGVRVDRQRFRYGTAGVVAVTETRWSPKLALLRRLGSDDTVYANLSSGTSPNQVVSSSNQSLPSRRSAQAELGWKSSWQGGRLNSELAVYRLEQSNMISSDLATPAAFDFTVAGKARSQGLEASLTGRASERLELSANYAYTAARYGDNAVYGGRQVPNVARQVLNLWGRYAWGQGSRTGAGWSVQGRRFADEANTTVLPGYARLDLVQDWTLPLGGQALALQLAVRNVFDKAYFASSHLHVSRWITPGQGRNVSLTALYRF